MRLPRLLSLAVFCALVSPLVAQTSTQLRDTGPRANRINVVFLAEGYTAAESSKFTTDATGFVQTLVGNESWSRFADQMNAFGIFVASNESGADDPATSTVRDTYFNSTFGTSGIDRLLTVGSGASGTAKVTALLNQFVPEYDVVVVLVNSTKYGGAGGSYAVTSLNSSSAEVLLHELGHSFAKLADEYVDLAAAPSYTPRESVNATQETVRDRISWGAFIQSSTPTPTPVPSPAPSDENTVGHYLGAYYRDTGFYRPTFNNKMRSLGRPFGPVNLRAFANEVHRLNLNTSTARPVVTRSPAAAVVGPGQSTTLVSESTGAGPLTYQWRLNGRYLVTGTNPTLQITGMDANKAGVYAIEVTNASGMTASAEASVTLPGGGTAAPTITPLPATASAASGQPLTLTAAISGEAPFAYQWSRNGTPIDGATSASYTITSVGASTIGSYTVAVTNNVGTSISTATTVSVAGSGPTITTHPLSTTVAVGASVTLRVTATGTGTFTYQWRKNGTAITGATASTLVINSAQTSDSGSYNVAVTNSGGTATSNPATLTVNAVVPLQPSWIANLSVMTSVATAGETFSMGYVVGNASTSDPKPLVVRVAGPSLAAFGMQGLLADPQMQLFAASTQTLSNNNWGGGATVASAMAGVGAFPFASASSADAAVAVNITSRDNSVRVSGVGSGTGTVLAEIYDATPAASFTTVRPRLVNVSVMKNIGTGLTVGFVIGPPGGTVGKNILVRAVGPTLNTAFGMTGIVANPQLTLYGAGSVVISSNDNWGGTTALVAAFNSVGAFALPATSQDAALMAQLLPGSYSVLVTGVGGGSGTALIEVYELP